MLRDLLQGVVVKETQVSYGDGYHRPATAAAAAAAAVAVAVATADAATASADATAACSSPCTNITAVLPRILTSLTCGLHAQQILTASGRK